ncbi:hypothetical protein OROMI_008174 [Orobanche minor]
MGVVVCTDQGIILRLEGFLTSIVQKVDTQWQRVDQDQPEDKRCSQLKIIGGLEFFRHFFWLPAMGIRNLRVGPGCNWGYKGLFIEKELSSSDDQFTASDVERALWSCAVGAKFKTSSTNSDEVELENNSKRKRKR